MSSVVLADVDLPSGVAVETLVGRVAPPETLQRKSFGRKRQENSNRGRKLIYLDQHGRSGNLPIEVLLALLLLDFECEARAKDALCVCGCPPDEGVNYSRCCSSPS